MLVRCLTDKHEDLSSIPLNIHEKDMLANSCIPSAGETADRQIPGACQPASLAASVSSRPVRVPASKQEVDSN